MKNKVTFEQQASKIIDALEEWQNKQSRTKGVIIDATKPFKFKDGQIHKVDGGWIKAANWEEALKQQKNGYPQIAPDFIVKFSAPDFQILESTKAEMAQLRDYGCPLGWLIEPKSETVFIYQPHQQIHQIPTFDYYIDGRGVLTDFEFPLKKLRF